MRSSYQTILKAKLLFNFFLRINEMNIKALMRRRERRKLSKLRNKTPRRMRRPLEEPVDREKDFWSTQWGTMIRRLSSLNEGSGPAFDSREGKLFRRRFRVPWPIYVDLCRKCIEKKIFGRLSSKDRNIHGKICPH